MSLTQSISGRTVFYILGIVSLVQIGVFLAMDISNTRAARTQIGSMLDDGVLSIRRTLDLRAEQLNKMTRALAADPALLAAIARSDSPAVSASLREISARLRADLLLVATPEGKAVADAAGKMAADTALPAPLRKAITGAAGGEKPAPMALDGQPYQLTLLPLRAPSGTVWLVAGFSLDPRLAEEMLQTTKLETSFAVLGASGKSQIVSSSLPAMRRAALNAAAARGKLKSGQTVPVDIFGEEFLTRTVPLGGNGVEAVLQSSEIKGSEIFEDAKSTVLFLSWGGLILSVFGALFLANVADPVRALTEAARSIGKGEYVAPKIKQKGEFGELAAAFGDLAQGLAQRDRVRSVLGKVVSPEIAAKVLASEVELAGALMPVTILFSDLRGFQAVGGPYGPREAVEILNVYLTRMTAVIEHHHGVVDKYLGGGIMALFGAPVPQDDDAGDALAAALAMLRDLDELNAELGRNALARLDMGIGIHTATVLAGNMGSVKRPSYSVIGDGVSFAARLEGLTAHGNVDARILASAATVRRAKRQFATRPLAASAVSGRNDPDLIYAVLGEAERSSAQPAAATSTAKGSVPDGTVPG
jgi:adenylate cyclase